MTLQGQEVAQATRVLRSARQAAGLAAYHYFFAQATPEVRAAYVAALAAEAEAELLLRHIADNGR